jgi:hypothetical protein
VDQKDVFIVHTQGDEREAALVRAFIPRLAEFGISVWVYKDWEWEHKVHRRGRGALRSFGRPEHLDLATYVPGRQALFRGPINEVNEGELAEMLHSSKVVVLCEPAHGAPSEGVLKESEVLADLSDGPILIHLLWSDSADEFFARLRPTLEIQVAESLANVSVVDEVLAGTVTAWLVYTLQRQWGRYGGHHLLVNAAAREPGLKTLIERSPQYSEPEALDRKPPEETLSPDRKIIRDMFARTNQASAEEFDEWWAECRKKFRPLVSPLRPGRCERMLHELLNS